MIKTLSDALAERGYETLTAVQEAVTDPELQEADLLVSAQTGSGKTVGFGLAIARTLLGDSEKMGMASAPLALVVAPTRELAFQVMRELEWLYAKANARVVSCVGGMDMRDERRALDRGAHIVVGTPGRLRDHIQRGSLDLGSLRAVVLDEADEMLDLGFREDLEFMLDAAPTERRTLLFSATVPPMIAKLAKSYQRDAVRVTTINANTQHSDITYQALRVAEVDAENAIVNVLRYHDAQNAIIFANTRAAVNRLTSRLSNRGFSVVTLSGELSQNERTHALQAMRDGRARVCVATDVAARGIDLPNLELVVHADLPSNAEGLLHRSGRTGRAGRKGVSALIVTPKMGKKAERLLKFAKIKAEWTVAPSAEEILLRDQERLLNDPVWQEEASETTAEFAKRLLDLHGAEKIASAYLSLYLSRQSAPEDLSPPDARPEPKERKPFGPSRWFALSIGRDDRAEPRWLLPLLCRAGNLTKEAIGAIRVQQSETYVELAEAAAVDFQAMLDGGGELEEGIKVRKMDRAPDRNAPQPRYDGPRKGPREGGSGPKRDHAPKPRYDSDAPKPARDTAPRPKRDHGDAPAGHFSEKPKGKFGDKPKGKFGDKPAGKFGGPKKRDDDAGGRPHKSGGKPGGKPFGKPGDKPTGKPAAARFDASDPSKRISRPGKPDKPRTGGAKGKPARAGGAEPPKRQPR